MLKGKRLLISGVVTTDSIAFATAHRAQQDGAQVVLTAMERDLDRCSEAAAQLQETPEVLPLNVTKPGDFDSLIVELRNRMQHLDGVLHAVAFAPRDALSGDFLEAAADGINLAFQTSAVSLAGMARVLSELAPPEGGSIVGLDFDAAGAWPVYNWMGVCKAALESTNRYLARDLGARNIRANLIAAGPLHTRAASGIAGFEQLLQAWERQSPLHWDPNDPDPVADAAVFLLSDRARAISGEILHVDGGYHAMAAPLRGGPLVTQEPVA